MLSKVRCNGKGAGFVQHRNVAQNILGHPVLLLPGLISKRLLVLGKAQDSMKLQKNALRNERSRRKKLQKKARTKFLRLY